jgi:hypothetical protein
MRAFAKAPSASSSFVPTAQVVREIAVALPRRQSFSANVVSVRGALPEATCTLAEANPFLLMARKWEQESYDLGLDPERPSPRGIGERRLQEIDKLLEHVAIEHTMPGPKQKRVAL